jgi:Phage integrase, N-terminal SAM-like domain
MATTSPSGALVPVVTPVFSTAERLALAGYSGLTRQAYELDLRQYASWCQPRHLAPFGARRAEIECFARDLEARGRGRATITRRLCTIAGLYREAVEESSWTTQLPRGVANAARVVLRCSASGRVRRGCSPPSGAVRRRSDPGFGRLGCGARPR